MKIAGNLDGCHHGDFCASIKKMKGDKSRFPTAVDSAGDVDSIDSLFHEKYKKLHNCVSYDEHQMAALSHIINGTPKLYAYLSLLFGAMLSHGCVQNVPKIDVNLLITLKITVLLL